MNVFSNLIHLFLNATFFIIFPIINDIVLNFGCYFLFFILSEYVCHHDIIGEPKA